MVRICVWVGICAMLAGCGPRDAVVCDEQHSAVSHARSLTDEQLSGLSERIIELREEMSPYETYPVPDDLEYLEAPDFPYTTLTLRYTASDAQIKLAGCIDEGVHLTHQIDDSGTARILLAWLVNTPNWESEVLWSGSIASEDEGFEGQLEPLIVSQYQEISTRYLGSANDFDRLADRMAQERNVVLVHCDENLRYVQTRTAIFYEGEDSDLLTTYLELCRFESKVVANNGHATGISFAHQMKEVGPILVSTGLVRRLDNSIDFERCAEVSLDEEWGVCQEPISGSWFAHFSWGRICTDDDGPEDGC
ncbi:MAG: hypothetical protein QNI99_00075 [Woeseiaceae bacterium]|nr:hypothetical protein [Woeseiaceae bacterium]